MTSGLVAYRDGEPVGWCAVESRAGYADLLRVYGVPWIGRAEDSNDATIWIVTCFFTRADFRPPGGEPCPCQRCGRFRQDARRPRHRRLPNDQAAGAGDCLGRAPCRRPQIEPMLPAVWISSNFIGLNFPANLASARHRKRMANVLVWGDSGSRHTRSNRACRRARAYQGQAPSGVRARRGQP